MVIHDIESNGFGAVFYPVVPDSFITLDTANRPARQFTTKFGALVNETDAPILAPHDPWSF